MKAKLVRHITVIDPDTKDEVGLSVFKPPGGGLFAIDSSYIDQCFDDDEPVIIPDPFDQNLENIQITLDI